MLYVKTYSYKLAKSKQSDSSLLESLSINESSLKVLNGVSKSAIKYEVISRNIEVRLFRKIVHD